MPRLAQLASAALLLYALVGCTSPPRHLQSAEDALDTGGPSTLLFHSTLYYPAELSLRFDGYVLGVEKSPRLRVMRNTMPNIQPRGMAGLSQANLDKRLGESKLLYISHVVESHADDSLRNCALYDAYEQAGVQPLAAPCADTHLDAGAPGEAFNNSWRALDVLQASVQEKVRTGRYTDVLVITMGWNTPQEEAIRNFNSIVTQIKASSTKRFNPIVIGVTWPSQWSSEWWGPLVRLLSFRTKADDADELGMTWLAVLLHQTLPAAKGNLPLTVIGHSFGSRAASLAACVGPVIYDKAPHTQLARIDTLINLQGAFSSERLFGAAEDDVAYPAGCPQVGRLVLTASSHDEAVASAWWTTYAGEEASFKKRCSGQGGFINCLKADAQGKLVTLNAAANSNIHYIDASDLIHEAAYLSGGGAHSDIYRREHGRMVHEIWALPSTQPQQTAQATP
jgi:pimeloyl-ACP methyl ester carboxylesterase